jgi:hypothetical protein
MGFEENKARDALLETMNNLEAAADLLVTVPFFTHTHE